MRFRGNPWQMPGWERQPIIPVYKWINKGLSKSSHHLHNLKEITHSHFPVLRRTPSVQLTQRLPSECVPNRCGRPQGYTCTCSAQANNERDTRTLRGRLSSQWRGQDS